MDRLTTKKSLSLIILVPELNIGVWNHWFSHDNSKDLKNSWKSLFSLAFAFMFCPYSEINPFETEL